VKAARIGGGCEDDNMTSDAALLRASRTDAAPFRELYER
jgi:hypothetical protein